MPSWPFWLLFLLAGVGALFAAKRLDDAERRRWSEQRGSSAPPSARR